ncbi:hypothetical protein G3I44_14170 [Halogeometricum borinquense]|uniref:Uncharacterized protein n=1 Tax=Halogeometricum borinquense TaxID=60847 RepID=A0A6C0UIK5_9EURY|nr:hypothetical protein [Halogeometricum borinquense]QIB75332.1 hypothetical protein G3I44_14170 [Halogeometricum borinquense]
MATIYYLNWDKERDNNGPATELFHNLHVGDAQEHIDTGAFDDLYREVADDVELENLEDAFAEWNRGSGRESQRFTELRYCERCDGYIDGHDEAITHAAQNHGYDAFTETRDPEYIRGERSLSVGDIVQFEDEYYVCASIGWEQVEIGGDRD